MNLSRYAAPLSTATLLLAFALLPLLHHAEATTCPDETNTSSSTCTTEPASNETATTTEENASTTPPAATSTPATDTSTSTATTSNDGTDTQENTNNSGGSNSPSNSTEKVRISIRNTNGTILASTISFIPDETVSVSPTDGNASIDTDGSSVLALLVALDDGSDKIEITDLQYYPSFGSFFLNCIEVAGNNLCGSWQYTVNGDYPSVGLDQYLLDDGDSIFLFFGSPRTVEVPSEVTINTEFTATALEYNPETDKYTPLSGYTIGIVQDDPDNPWSPKEILTKKVNKSGKATFTLDTLGGYNVGLQDDYYFPTTPLKVIEQVTNTSSAGGTVSSPTTDKSTFDVTAARSYIVSKQNEGGSFGAPLYSDWAAIALATGGSDESLNKVRAYLKNADGSSPYITDHLRRAMALMAVGMSPYDGTNTDHIEAIRSTFDGTQLGEQFEINDDIFGLLVLLATGYKESDEVVTKLVSHITSSQNANGSWGATVDMTAAAIQALTPFKSDAAVTARAKARAYLKAQQRDDGGFGNSFATSWALLAIAALNETPENWRKSDLSPLDYLASVQQDDGGLEDSSAPEKNRLWATSYAVPAALGHTWLEIMHNFAKPVVLGVTTEQSNEDATSEANNPLEQQNTVQQSASSQNTNTAFRFLSDQNTTVYAETAAVATEEKLQSNDKATSPSKSTETEEKNDSGSFFSRLFSKFGSIIFFWK